MGSRGGLTLPPPGIPGRAGERARALGRALGRPAVLPLPAWVLKLALGQMAEELLLAMWVSHQAAEAEGSRAADAFELKSPTASSEVDTRVMNSRRLVLTLNARISRVSVLIATT